MPQDYTIYVANQSTTKSRFWCFLEKPQDIPASDQVYANSSASMTIDKKSVSTNKFSIPIQYKIDAGCSNKAIGLNVFVQSNTPTDVDLGQVWGAKYYPPSDTQGPDVAVQTATTDKDKVGIETNSWDKGEEAPDSWYSFMTFGKQAANGFIGFTWSPDPNTNTTIEPIVTFYIATGAYGSNELADWTKVSTNSAKVTGSDFSDSREATVVYDSSGNWTVTPGKPSISNYLDMTGSTIGNDALQLAALRYLSSDVGVTDTIKSVKWLNTGSSAQFHNESGLNTYLAGQLTVTAAIALSATYFFLSGIQFTIGNIDSDRTTFYFSYNGTDSASFIENLFKVGAQIYLGTTSA